MAYSGMRGLSFTRSEQSDERTNARGRLLSPATRCPGAGAAEAAGAAGGEQRCDGTAVPAGLHHTGEDTVFVYFIVGY